MEQKQLDLTAKDYLLISFIALSFTAFTLPIIKTLNIEFLKPSFSFFVLAAVFFIILANFALWVSLVISKKISVFLQVAKFGAVGAFNTFLNWAVVNLLMLVTQQFEGAYYAVFMTIGFIVSNAGSFFWNKYWIFPTNEIADHDSAKKDFAQFFIISLIGMGIQIGVASALVNFVETSASAGVWANAGLLLGTVFSMIWNFLGYKFIVFKK